MIMSHIIFPPLCFYNKLNSFRERDLQVHLDMYEQRLSVDVVIHTCDDYTEELCERLAVSSDTHHCTDGLKSLVQWH